MINASSLLCTSHLCSLKTRVHAQGTDLDRLGGCVPDGGETEDSLLVEGQFRSVSVAGGDRYAALLACLLALQ